MTLFAMSTAATVNFIKNGADETVHVFLGTDAHERNVLPTAFSVNAKLSTTKIGDLGTIIAGVKILKTLGDRMPPRK